MNFLPLRLCYRCKNCEGLHDSGPNLGPSAAAVAGRRLRLGEIRCPTTGKRDTYRADEFFLRESCEE